MAINITERSRQTADEITKALKLLNPNGGNCLYNTSKNWGEGMFDVLVMGRFRVGKRTFLNALEASKGWSGSGNLIEVVEYGHKENEVIIVESGPKNWRTFSVNEYKSAFDVFADSDTSDRFSSVEYVLKQSENDLYSNGLRFALCPEIEDDDIRTKVTNNFVPKADAIIFVMNAISLFPAIEREYIAENFAGKYRKNVFFVVNRINQVVPCEDVEKEVKPRVKAGLKEVFSDENGNFDENLYNKRVFFVDAYRAYCARTDTPMEIMLGRKQISVKADVNYSGIPEFEEGLSVYLNSGERFDAAGHAILEKTLRRITGQF